MAKSFHNILKEGTIEVNHNGEDVLFDLPNLYVEDMPDLMDKDALVKWAEDNDVIHGLLHKGIQKDIIDIRAEARPADVKDPNGLKGDMIKVSLVVDAENAQDRIDKHEIKPTPPPGTSAKANKEETELASALKMVNSMLTANVPKEQVITIVNTSDYSDKIKTMIVETIN